MTENGDNKLNLPVASNDGLKKLLETMKSKVEAILPKHITPERILKMALIASSRNPKLYECSMASWVQAIMRSSELGLDCSGTLGEAYIVPFYNGKTSKMEAQFMPGYRGLMELARRSGKVTSIEVHNVYKRDKFRLVYGTASVLEHEPYLDGDPGAFVCSYMVATLKDGSKQIEVMTDAQIEAVRARSKAKDSGPWKTDTDEMRRKTVSKRGMKYLPLSAELETAIGYDNEVVGFEDAIPAVGELIEDREADLKQKLQDKGIDTGGMKLGDRTFEEVVEGVKEPIEQFEENPEITKKEPDAPKIYQKKPKQDKLDV